MAKNSSSPWTAEMDQHLAVLLQQGVSTARISVKLKRTVSAVQSRTFILRQLRKGAVDLSSARATVSA